MCRYNEQILKNDFMIKINCQKRTSYITEK